jgi:hypothetical protein
MGDTRTEYRIVMRRSLGSRRHRWEDIQMIFSEIGYERVDRIYLAQEEASGWLL